MENITKKILSVVILLTLLSFAVKGQTNVSGGIFTNTTWTLVNSPYIVTDTVVVFPGVTLTIQPGVTVKFADHQKLEIRQAKLIAAGTSAAPITFTSNSSSPTLGIHNGIFINGGTLPPVFNFCNFLYANEAIRAIVGYTLTVKNSSVISNNFGILTQYVTIDSCVFKYNNEAIYADGIISNSRITQNLQGLVQPGNSSTVSNCIVDSNQVGVSGTAGSVLNCSIKYNITGLVCGYPTTVDSCTIISNQTGVIIPSNTTIKNSLIDSNSVVGIVHDGGHYDAAHNVVYNCQIRYNGTGINESESQNTTTNNSIIKNNIENNTIGILISNNPFIHTMDLENVYCNKICNNLSYDLRYLVPFNSSIGSNYWCTSDSASTEAVIFDAYDNAIYGIVDFMPLDTSMCYLTFTGIPVHEAQDFSFSVFPNPAIDHLTVELPSTISKTGPMAFGIKIFNLLGELKYSSKATEQKTDIDISSFTTGIYIIQVTTGNTISRQKFIRQ